MLLALAAGLPETGCCSPLEPSAAALTANAEDEGVAMTVLIALSAGCVLFVPSDEGGTTGDRLRSSALRAPVRSDVNIH
jgi:hypothetical protein